MHEIMWKCIGSMTIHDVILMCTYENTNVSAAIYPRILNLVHITETSPYKSYPKFAPNI